MQKFEKERSTFIVWISEHSYVPLLVVVIFPDLRAPQSPNQSGLCAHSDLSGLDGLSHCPEGIPCLCFERCVFVLGMVEEEWYVYLCLPVCVCVCVCTS